MRMYQGNMDVISRLALAARFACLVFLIGVSLIGVTGCAVAKGKGQTFELTAPPPGQGLVYHYRLSKYGSYAVYYNVFANDEPLVVIGSGGYYPQVVAPGTMTYKTLPRAQYQGLWLVVVALSNALAKEEPVFELEVKPGEVRFVRWDHAVNFWTGSVRKPKVTEVPAEVATKEMKGLRQFSELTVKQENKMEKKRK